MCSDKVMETAIAVRDLSKRYEIYDAPQDRLKQMVLPRFSRAAGRPGRQYFREFWALRDVNLTVNRGETVAIIGQNGSGKSTFLQLVCGTLTPTQGSVTCNGRVAALLELGAGFNPEFTGEENVYLSGMLYGLTEKQLKERYQSIIDFAEIGDFVTQPVKTYSSGMYVRLAFAIAAHVDADVLVVDEALSVGDVRFTQKCMRFLRTFQKNGTLLFVSHDVGAVTSLCSRAVWLDRGRVLMDGNSKETVEAYLAQQHALDRSTVGHTVKVSKGPQAAAQTDDDIVDFIDKRWEMLRERGAGTRLEVFEFDPELADQGFGAGGATIRQVELRGADGSHLSIVEGGELVELRIVAQVNLSLRGIIFGFYLKDRLGQRLFGDNTYLTYLDAEISALAGETLRASFKFRIPVMPVGAYSFDVAIASGEQHDHTQQHWIHDALTFRAVDSSMRHGLIGIPMLDIEICQEG